MNNTINKIKLFFKGNKPARIIIALLVIAAIMTGVAFAVIALVNTFKSPPECPINTIRYDGKTPESRGNDFNGFCGPACESDEEVCPKYKDDNIVSISCVPKCSDGTYSIKHCNGNPDQYCEKDCSVFDFHDDGYKINPSSGKLECTQTCPDEKTICYDNTYCFSNSDSTYSCFTSTNGKSPYCPPDKENYIICNDNQVCNSSTEECILKSCSNDEVILSDDISCSELNSSYSEGYDSSLTEKLIYKNVCTDENGNTRGLSGGSNCTKVNTITIGPDGNTIYYCKSTQIGFNKAVQCLPGNNSYCLDDVNKLCANGWQLDNGELGKCVTDPASESEIETYAKNESYSEISQFLKDNSYCCAAGHTKSDGTCCSFSVIEDDRGKECMGSTQFQIDKNIYPEIFSGVPSTTDCNALQSNLEKQIDSSSKSQYKILSNNFKDPNYTKIIDTDGKGTCRLQCGYSSGNTIYPLDISEGDSGKSLCFTNNNFTLVEEDIPKKFGTGNKIIGCQKDCQFLDDGTFSCIEPNQYYWRVEDNSTDQYSTCSTKTYSYSMKNNDCNLTNGESIIEDLVKNNYNNVIETKVLNPIIEGDKCKVQIKSHIGCNIVDGKSTDTNTINNFGKGQPIGNNKIPYDYTNCPSVVEFNNNNYKNIFNIDIDDNTCVKYDNTQTKNYLDNKVKNSSVQEENVIPLYSSYYNDGGRPYQNNNDIIYKDDRLKYDLFLSNGKIVDKENQITRDGNTVNPVSNSNQIKENFENLMDDTMCSLEKSNHDTCGTNKPDSKYWLIGEGLKCDDPLINYKNDVNCQSIINWSNISKNPANQYPYVTNIKIDDNGIPKNFVIDNNKQGVWGGYCSIDSDGTTSEPCCRDVSVNQLKLTNNESDNLTFSCPPPAPSPTPTGYYKCTNSDKDTVTKDGKTYTRVKEVMNPPGITPGTDVTMLTTDPSVCNLTKDLIYMRGRLQGGQGTIGTGSRPICQLIKCKEKNQKEPGYTTAGKCFSNLNPKGGKHVLTPYEALDMVYVPNGVNSEYWDWASGDKPAITNTCTSAVEFHNEKFPGNAAMGPPDGQPVSTLEGGCYIVLPMPNDDDRYFIDKAHFSLQPRNPNACDGYSYPEPFDFDYTGSNPCEHCGNLP